MIPTWSAVKHRERGGRAHTHIFATRCTLETRRRTPRVKQGSGRRPALTIRNYSVRSHPAASLRSTSRRTFSDEGTPPSLSKHSRATSSSQAGA